MVAPNRRSASIIPDSWLDAVTEATASATEIATIIGAAKRTPDRKYKGRPIVAGAL